MDRHLNSCQGSHRLSLQTDFEPGSPSASRGLAVGRRDWGRADGGPSRCRHPRPYLLISSQSHSNPPSTKRQPRDHRGTVLLTMSPGSVRKVASRPEVVPAVGKPHSSPCKNLLLRSLNGCDRHKRVGNISSRDPNSWSGISRFGLGGRIGRAGESSWHL